MEIDCAFPGGNIVVDAVEGDRADVHQDLRDTAGDWFYWCFRLRGAAGHSVTVRFTGSDVIGVRGPAVSLDGGWTWRWLGAEAVAGKSFRYAVPADADDVRFSFGMPYQEAHLRRFLASHRGHPRLETGVLCATDKGRAAEWIRLGRLDGACAHRVLLTARHHCCEMMASYALEGLMETVLTEPGVGAWLREQVEFLVIPFVDKDGVEEGDQGKNRKPRDHCRDYLGDSIHATTRAIRDFVPRWSGDRLRLAVDLHCPWIRGDLNECIYFVGGTDQAVWSRVQQFTGILARVQAGPLVYNPADNLPFGQGWNVAANWTQGQTCSGWVAGLPGTPMGSSVEIPYANVKGGEVNADSARAFGRDLAGAIRVFLEQGS